MSSRPAWKLKAADGTVTEFQDIRRKVGNRIIRAYLLEAAISGDRIERIKATLRGPRNEFKDFDNFFVLWAKSENGQFKILVEANVYENLRIVATDNAAIAEKEPTDIVAVLTEALAQLDLYGTKLVMSQNSKVRIK
ncbi:MAG: hypothetical protein ACFFD9_06375 [Candidatus Thorarchaeota archaeon]